MIAIKPFEASNQDEIDFMIKEISSEFGTAISGNNESPKSNLYDKHWVAFNDNEVVGTSAILRMGKGCSILKNMFVKKDYRGKEFNIANSLLQEVFNWCESENIGSIYLGTMTQFKAAHKFYEKNGFRKIYKNELPASFIHNPIDDIFYENSLMIIQNKKTNQ
jgi:N-acetylglutamate synthase-like GNAT family acetyltransferase